MYVRAISVGHAVPRMQFDTVVHSVFASAVNLRPDGSRQLLTLLTCTQGDLPQGIRLEASASAPFERLQPEMRAACREGLLRFDELPLTVDLQQAACWDSRLPTLQARMHEPEGQAAWQRAWHALNEQQAVRASEMRASSLLVEQPGAQPAWVQQARRDMLEVVRGTIECDAGVVSAMQDLIGLGPGLTPSGDDLAGGYLLGLHYSARARQERSDFLAELTKAVMSVLDRTGDISGTYLFHAAHGEPSQALFDLASAVCTGAGERTVLACAQAAMSFGHTSGMDAVTGLLIGLAAWDAPELVRMGAPGDRQAH